LIPHYSGILENIRKFSFIQTRADILNILKPNGQWIGKEGTRSTIRLFQSGENEARKVFQKLTKEGKIVYSETSITICKLPDDIYITYRPLSTSGPPTIDIKIKGIKDNIKLKFLDKK
jgi:hypothetical protein